jgi:hypothetical protein
MAATRFQPEADPEALLRHALEITTWRCERCFYLESYALP